MNPNQSLPTRTLREHPDLNQLKRQAKELLEAYRSGEHDAVTEVNAHYRDADPVRFALHDAQLVIARAYGFESWPRLKAYVDGVTVTRLADAVKAGNLQVVRTMLERRPELVDMDMAADNEHRALHYAVLSGNPAMVRLLMEYGSDARKGIYPTRDATSAWTIARERGYEEIAGIIEAEEARRAASGGVVAEFGPLIPPELEAAFARNDEDAAIGILSARPEVAAARRNGYTVLHAASAKLLVRVAAWLLENGPAHGLDPGAQARDGYTALEMAGVGRPEARATAAMSQIADLLRAHGAGMTARSAVVLGDADWLRARHAQGRLENPIGERGGLLTLAVTYDRTEILKLLLEQGFDPNERRRVEGLEQIEFSQGMPLYECAVTGNQAAARLLLEHGADPNAEVYASGSPVFRAYGRKDRAMIELLEQYGGALDAASVGYVREVGMARRMLTGEVDPRLERGRFSGDTVAEQILWSGASGGEPDIVRMALPQVDWERQDRRWHAMLWRPLPGHRPYPEEDRERYLSCFRMVLDRCDPDVEGRYGLRMLHQVAARCTGEEAAAFARPLLEAGARLDLRDDLLKSTPLGWACRWGRVEMVRLLLEHGADPVEPDAKPWARPRAWAEKKGHEEVLALLA